ncbi:MAG: B12-binding domain-containing radical SAM protein [Phycisphaerae bacterium]
MNTLLIYPEFPHTFWSYTHALRYIGKRAVLPPLGLLTVAALLPKSWQVRLVDLNVGPLKRHDLAWAEQVFVSAMAVQQDSARRVIAQCQAAGLRVVAGGPLFTSQRDSFPEVDHLVLNEAELTLPLFLADLAAGRPQRVYATKEWAQMEASPVPRFELADLRRYAMMPIQYSRGCPFDCEFCDVTAQLGHLPRFKSAPQMVAELDRLQEIGWKSSVFWVDDNLIGNKRHLQTEVLPAVREWQTRHRPTAFNSQVSINLADDPALIDQMARAGFNTVFIGIETPDHTALAGCHKKQNLNRDLLADVRRIQAAGIQVQGGFIVGFDQDSTNIFHRQVGFIQASGIVTAMVGVLQAMRGTKLYERLQREKRLTSESGGNNVASFSNFEPLMGTAQLREGYGYVLRTIYSPRSYYERVRVFLRNYQRPRIQAPLAWQDLRAFARSMVMLGIVGRERFEYWRLLVWTIFHRPRLLPMAVYLSVLGNHYRGICQKYLRVLKTPTPAT